MNARSLVRVVLTAGVLLWVACLNAAAAGGSAPLWSPGESCFHPVVAVAPEVRRVSCTCPLCDAEGWYNPFAARGGTTPAPAVPVPGHLHTYFPPELNRVPEVKKPSYEYPVDSPLNGWSPWGLR